MKKTLVIFIFLFSINTIAQENTINSNNIENNLVDTRIKYANNSNFFEVIKNTSLGDIVKLTEDIKSKDYGTHPRITLNGITLDGTKENGRRYKLDLVGMPIYLNGESTIKNLNLSLTMPEAQIDFNLRQNMNDNTVPIFANGYNLTLDNVDTTVENRLHTQPTILMGGDSSSNVTTDNTLKIINAPGNFDTGESKFKNIIAGSLDTARSGKSRIEIGPNVNIVGYNSDQNAGSLGKKKLTLRNEGENVKK